VTIGITENFQGSMSGTYVGTERDVVYANGSATFHGNGVFTGTIAGRTGTASYRYEGVFPVGSPSFHANWVLIGKTGGLASQRPGHVRWRVRGDHRSLRRRDVLRHVPGPDPTGAVGGTVGSGWAMPGLTRFQLSASARRTLPSGTRSDHSSVVVVQKRPDPSIQWVVHEEPNPKPRPTETST
jgi:hypothetical protein